MFVADNAGNAAKLRRQNIEYYLVKKQIMCTAVLDISALELGLTFEQVALAETSVVSSYWPFAPNAGPQHLRDQQISVGDEKV